MLFERISSQRDPGVANEARRYSRQESGSTAGLLACLAVIDERRAFRALGYSSIAEFCHTDLGLSEDVTKKYLGAARTAREYPVIFDMVADRRLSVSAVLTLRSWLNPACGLQLLADCAGKSREEIEWILAERFPSSDVLALECSTAAPGAASAPGHPVPCDSSESNVATVPILTAVHAPAKLKPLSPDRVALTVTISRETREKLRRAQELLGHAVAPEAIADVIDRALDQLIVALEKRKHGLHRKARGVPARASHRARHIPADVRAEVYKRDGGACTFVSDDGRRCTCRHALQYDHIVPVAQGGASTAENLRLLCPAHNQLEAERRFGREFIEQERAASRSGRLQPSEPKEKPKEQLKAPHEDDVRAALTELGYRRAEVSIGLSAAAMLSAEAGAEARVRAALTALSRGFARKQEPGVCDRSPT
jgi:hypothetical protein